MKGVIERKRRGVSRCAVILAARLFFCKGMATEPHIAATPVPAPVQYLCAWAEGWGRPHRERVRRSPLAVVGGWKGGALSLDPSNGSVGGWWWWWSDGRLEEI